MCRGAMDRQTQAVTPPLLIKDHPPAFCLASCVNFTPTACTGSGNRRVASSVFSPATVQEGPRKEEAVVCFL